MFLVTSAYHPETPAYDDFEAYGLSTYGDPVFATSEEAVQRHIASKVAEQDEDLVLLSTDELSPGVRQFVYGEEGTDPSDEEYEDADFVFFFVQAATVVE